MGIGFIRIAALVSIAATLFFSACASDSDSPVSADNKSGTGKNGDAQLDNDRAIDVEPLFRRAVGRNEYLSLFVFYARPVAPVSCSDPNTNQAYSGLGAAWSARGMSGEYHPLYEPESVRGSAFDAMWLGFAAWARAVNDSALVSFGLNANGRSGPTRDNVNVVGWRRLAPRNVLAATWVWDNGAGVILEADIFFNTGQEWSVNASIQPGATTCGSNFDVQAIATHEIGHFFGLGHVSSDGNAGNGDENDATMAPTAAKKELMKQTLTRGDLSGAVALIPA